VPYCTKGDETDIDFIRLLHEGELVWTLIWRPPCPPFPGFGQTISNGVL